MSLRLGKAEGTRVRSMPLKNAKLSGALPDRCLPVGGAIQRTVAPLLSHDACRALAC
jgi:hypothetical protein